MVTPEISSDSNTPAPVILVTGFDAFDGAARNPSWELAQCLHGQTIADHRVVAAQLPTCFGLSLQRLDDLMQQWQPALVLCLGLAGQRRALSIERVAINVDDARIPDNAGAQPVDEPVVPGAPAAYFSRLPIKAMAQAVLAAGVPAEISQTAGTFVCNHVFYGLLHRLASTPAWAQVRGGFVHVPWPDESVDLGLEALARGLGVALQAGLTVDKDLQLAAGALE